MCCLCVFIGAARGLTLEVFEGTLWAAFWFKLENGKNIFTVHSCISPPPFKPLYHLIKIYGELMLQTSWKLQMNCLSSLHSALQMSRLLPLALCPSDLCSSCLPSAGNWSSSLLTFCLVHACVPPCVGWGRGGRSVSVILAE